LQLFVFETFKILTGERVMSSRICSIKAGNLTTCHCVERSSRRSHPVEYSGRLWA